LEEYIKIRYKCSDIHFNKLQEGFLEDFDRYLKKSKGLQQSTINKTIQRFRTVLKRAQSKGYLANDPFLMFKYKKVYKEVTF